MIVAFVKYMADLTNGFGESGLREGADQTPFRLEPYPCPACYIF